MKDYLIFIYCFFIPFTGMELFYRPQYLPIPITDLLLVLISGLFLHEYIISKKIRIRTNSKAFIICFFTPIFISLLFLLFNLLTIENQISYYRFLKDNLPSRFIHIIFFFILFIGLSDYSLKKYSVLLKGYLLGSFVIVIFGLWQWSSFYFDIPYVEISTRDEMRSIGDGYIEVKKRVTSLLAEPAYLSVILVDGLILVSLLRINFLKRIIFFFIPNLFVLVYTYSLGGYINFIFLLIGRVFFKRKNIKSILICFFMGAALLYYFYDNIMYLFIPIIARLNLFDFKNIFNNDSRIFMVLYPLYLITNSNPINFLFGYGAGSYKHLSLYLSLPNGEPFHITSNCLYTDIFFETGLLGLGGIVGYYIYYFVFFLKHREHKLALIGYSLVAHLFISSFYTVAFMSPRFFFLMITLDYLRRRCYD